MQRLTIKYLAKLAVYELSGCLFESRYSHLNFRYRVYFEQGSSLTSRQLQCADSLRRLCDMNWNLVTIPNMKVILYSTKQGGVWTNHNPW